MIDLQSRILKQLSNPEPQGSGFICEEGLPLIVFGRDAFQDCLANAYLELGRLDEAIAEYQRVISINPNYPLAHYHLAEAC